MKLTLSKEKFKLSDLIGNMLYSQVVTYKIPVEHRRINDVSDLYFSKSNIDSKAIQIHIGKHEYNGYAYKYKIFNQNITSVEQITYHQIINETWKLVKNLDIIKVEDYYYIGIVEINSDNKAIRYSYTKIIAKHM